MSPLEFEEGEGCGILTECGIALLQ